MMNFAQTLTELRKSHGQTQEELGAAIGVSGKTVSKWENGSSEPDFASLEALRLHFAVGFDELFGRSATADAVTMMRRELDAEESMAAKFKRVNCYASGLIHAMFGRLDEADGETMHDAIPAGEIRDGDYRTVVQHPMGTFVAYHNDEVKAAAQVWRNDADFAWLRDDARCMADFFALFADPDMLTLLYTLERLDFSLDFTAAYAAEQAGLDVGRVEALLECMLEIRGYSHNSGTLEKLVLETLDGERTVYRFNGCGTTMAMLSLARALVRGWGSNRNAYHGCGKMIGERGQDHAAG